VTLTLAAVAIAAAIGVPFIQRNLDDAAAKRDRDDRDRADNRGKFAQHAIDLNSHAYQTLIGLVLNSPLESPPISGGLDRPANSGIHVRLADGGQTPVEGLPNWPFALEHLKANAELRSAWEDANAKAGLYYGLREKWFNATAARFRVLIADEYGPEMRFTNNFSDVPIPWADP
jgi:hypothetical protein